MLNGETICTIHWIEIFPLDSAIHLFNNWGQISTACTSRSNDNEICFLNKSAHASYEIDEAFYLTYRKYFVFAENLRQNKTTLMACTLDCERFVLDMKCEKVNY